MNEDPQFHSDLEGALRRSRPEADPAFQERLENSLLDQLEQKREKNLMRSNGHLNLYDAYVMPPKSPRRGRLSLTSAALLAAVIVAAFLWGFSQRDGDQAEVASLQRATATITPSATFTPTALATELPPTIVPQSIVATASGTPLDVQSLPPSIVPTVVPLMASPTFTVEQMPTAVPPSAPNGDTLYPVVIARQNILRGTKLTAEMLDVVYYPVQLLLEGSFRQIDSLLDEVAISDIRRYTPLHISHIRSLYQDPARPESADEEQMLVTFLLDPDRTFILEVGDRVDVISALTVVDVCPDGEDDCEYEYTQALADERWTPIARNAEVVYMYWDEEVSYIMLGTTAEEADVVQWAVDNDVALDISLHRPQD
jgi:hypothetical protein